MKKAVLFASVFLLTFFPAFVYAIQRNDSQLSFGIFAGANRNEITGTRQTLFPGPFDPGHAFENKERFGFSGGIFVNARPWRWFAVQPELGFSMMHGMLSYSDVADYEFDITFKYNYLTAGVGFKFYPWRNLFLSVTPQVGFHLTPNNIFYVSNDAGRFGPDHEQMERGLRHALKARPNATLGFGLGYQFWNRLYITARYYLGLSDIIETFPNPNRFVETRNLSNGFQVTLGFGLPVFPGFTPTTGRNNSPLSIGFFAGANRTHITGIEKMLAPEIDFNGSFETRDRFGFLGGVFLNYRPSHLFSIQPELGFAMQHTEINFSNAIGHEYDLVFKYNYLNVGVGFKFYPWRNLFLSVTPQVGYHLTPNRLFYTSNFGEEFGDDLQSQQLKRNVIKGRTNVSLGLGLGYQFLNRFYVDFRYNLGLSDMIETLSNSYGFVENTNFSNGLQLTIGWAIPLR